jgi:hypothetical protein
MAGSCKPLVPLACSSTMKAGVTNRYSQQGIKSHSSQGESEPLLEWLCPCYPTSTSSDEKVPTVICNTQFFVTQ